MTDEQHPDCVYPHHSDIAYEEVGFEPPQIEHKYGEGVYLLNDTLTWTDLATFGAPNVFQPTMNHLTRVLTFSLLRPILNTSFPRKMVTVDTRMKGLSSAGQWSGQILDPDTRVIVVNVMRAGNGPSSAAFEFIAGLMKPGLVRCDHLIMERETDDNGKVINVKANMDKIGKEADDAIVLFLDPMGATGGSTSKAIQIYKDLEGTARKFILGFFMVTPECIKRVRDDHGNNQSTPGLEIFALRLDRGMSPPEVLRTAPGTHWDQERGLTRIPQHQDYIVPGAGDVGQAINNV